MVTEVKTYEVSRVQDAVLHGVRQVQGKLPGSSFSGLSANGRPFLLDLTQKCASNVAQKVCVHLTCLLQGSDTSARLLQNIFKYFLHYKTNVSDSIPALPLRMNELRFLFSTIIDNSVMFYIQTTGLCDWTFYHNLQTQSKVLKLYQYTVV